MLKKFLKYCYFSFRLLFPSKEGVSILMYHSVGESNAFFTVSPKKFERQLKYIKQKGLKTVFLGEAISDLLAKKSENEIVLTFDDGYTDNFTTVLPLLRKYGMKATFFIPTGKIGSEMTTSDGVTLSVMDMEQILHIAKEERETIELMPHTVSHPDLSRLSKEEVYTELKESKGFIEKITGKPALVLAYPKGRYNNTVVDAAKESGYKGAVTVKKGVYSLLTNKYEIPRNSVDRETSFVEFKAKVFCKI